MNLEYGIIYYILTINFLSYIFMCFDKLKSIYRWWRISETTLWILAICGGVFGIWLGMQYPFYHKAGKRVFRFWIPLIALFWGGIVLYFIK